MSLVPCKDCNGHGYFVRGHYSEDETFAGDCEHCDGTGERPWGVGDLGTVLRRAEEEGLGDPPRALDGVRRVEARVWVDGPDGVVDGGDYCIVYIDAPVTEADKAAARAELHLDDPLPVRYGHWLVDAVQGGKSLSSASEVFTVHLNPWAVMNFGGANRRRLRAAALADARVRHGYSRWYSRSNRRV